MADLYAVAGCHFYIGGQKASQSTDFVASDFAGQSWVEVDGWETMGPFGDTAALISVPLINRGRDVKLKGTANAGSMQNNFASLPTDAGQVILLAAGDASDRNNYAFRVDLNDQVGAGQPSKRYFVGLVMSAQEQGGNANTARLLQATIEINSNVVKVAAT